MEAYLQEEREKLGSLETNPNTRDEKKDLQPAIRTNATGLSESYEDHSIIRFVIEPLIVAQDFFKKLLFKMSCLEIAHAARARKIAIWREPLSIFPCRSVIQNCSIS